MSILNHNVTAVSAILNLCMFVYQEGIDKIFFLLFSVMDENESCYLEDNIAQFAPDVNDTKDEGFMESNMMHGNRRIWPRSLAPCLVTSQLSCCWCVFWISAINGRMYGNLEGLEMCAGDKVMWYTFGLGAEVDIHGVHFEGNTFKKQGTTRDTLNLFPHAATAVFMQPSRG